MTLSELRGDIVILACAVSAGIHAALVPAHFREGTGPGVGFVVATVLLAALAVVLTRSPSQLALAGATTVFVGLFFGYAFASTTGIPVFHPDVEPVDGLAVFTKAVELIGLFTASSLIGRPLRATFPSPKGTLT